MGKLTTVEQLLDGLRLRGRTPVSITVSPENLEDLQGEFERLCAGAGLEALAAALGAPVQSKPEVAGVVITHDLGALFGPL